MATENADRSAAAAFIVLEGLSGTGKSTIAPMLATALDADLLDTLNDAFEPLRRHVDACRSTPARVHFWLAVNYLASEAVSARLRTGRSVVMESYFHRTLATHAAMDLAILPEVDWRQARRPDHVIVLTASPAQRAERLSKRPASRDRDYWYQLQENHVERSERYYAACGATLVDTGGKAPATIVSEIIKLLRREVS